MFSDLLSSSSSPSHSSLEFDRRRAGMKLTKGRGSLFSIGSKVMTTSIFHGKSSVTTSGKRLKAYLRQKTPRTPLKKRGGASHKPSKPNFWYKGAGMSRSRSGKPSTVVRLKHIGPWACSQESRIDFALSRSPPMALSPPHPIQLSCSPH